MSAVLFRCVGAQRLISATARKAPPSAQANVTSASVCNQFCNQQRPHLHMQVSKEYAERHRQQLKAQRASRAFQGSERAPWIAPGDGPASEAELASIGSWRSREDDFHQAAAMSLTASAAARCKAVAPRAPGAATVGTTSSARQVRVHQEHRRCGSRSGGDASTL